MANPIYKEATDEAVNKYCDSDVDAVILYGGVPPAKFSKSIEELVSLE